ncbi:MAG: PP2C family protein-serine/threonine phosphatase [Massilia sp.]
MYVWKQLSPSIAHQLATGPAFGMTDTGTVRPSNEDNFLIDPTLGLLAVADGMGGHEAGEIASSDALIAVSQFIRARADNNADDAAPNFQPSIYDPARLDPDVDWTDASYDAMITLHDAIEYANQRMYQTNVENRKGAGGGMGTTLTGIWQPQSDGPALVFHVGDSRLYRMRAGQLDQLTQDQTLYQSVYESGIRTNLPPRNLLLQALGPAPAIKPELQASPVAPGDLYLLCSDGLHGTVSDAKIADVMATALPADLGASCAELIEMAKMGGSRDNITVLLFQCQAG